MFLETPPPTQTYTHKPGYASRIPGEEDLCTPAHWIEGWVVRYGHGAKVKIPLAPRMKSYLFSRQSFT
jgi:hypothetical protein